jgi:hypothetical protein
VSLNGALRPRFYYVTLPLSSIVLGAAWYLPYELERQRVNQKTLVELWKPWFTELLK